MISYPTVCSILLSSFMLSFLSMSFEIVFVLFSYTKIELGGIGRSVSCLSQRSHRGFDANGIVVAAADWIGDVG